jgi:predicted MPP superfamily phosphohydrolase
MPKRFIVFIVIAQSILTFFYWLSYKSLLIFFPALIPHSSGILTTFFLLSFSFLFFSILGSYRDNYLLSKGYILSSIIMMLGFYFLIASVPTQILTIFFPNYLDTWGIFALLFSSLITIYGLINARIIRIVNLNIKLPNLNPLWKKRTVVALSDLHLGQILRTGAAKKIAAKIKSLNPDIVFIPGDFYDGVRTDFQALANQFSSLNAPLGTYFSSGNHELFAGYQICEDAIKKAGIKILEDEKMEIDGLQIIGMSYLGNSETHAPENEKNVKERIQAMKIDPNKPSVLLKHVPNHLSVIEEMGINFQISGHSHHGQVWPGRHLTKKVWKGFDYGFKILGNLQVYTSSGVGTWGPPLRVFTKSEIVKITFE